jgi:hypothetical protein
VTDARADYHDGTPHDTDSSECLLVIGGYADTAAVLSSVAEKASRRIMMSPTLGDFIEVRYVDIGDRPRDAAERATAIARITRELTQPRDGAGRTYFALVIADRSATAVMRVLADCADAPVIAGLPIRSRGFASVDDRRPAVTEETAPAADIVLSDRGSWRQDDLATEVRRYAHGLLRAFAAGPEPGLTPAQLTALREESERTLAPAEDSPAPEGPPPEGPDQPDTAGRTLKPTEGKHRDDRKQREAPEQRPWPPEPDELRPQPTRKSSPRPAVPDGAAPARASRPWIIVVLIWVTRAAVLAWRGLVFLGRMVVIAAKWTARRAAGRPRRTGRPHPGEVPAGEAGRLGLLFLLLIGGSIGDHAAWRHGRSVLRQVDEMIATTPGTTYWVRAAHHIESAAERRPRPAGQVARRDMKRSAAHPDFARTLSVIRVLLNRDLGELEPAVTGMARPALVFFALSAPPADHVTAGLYAELARTVAIIWVVSEHVKELMAPQLTEAAAAVVLDHPDVAREVARLLLRVTQEDRT